MTQNIQNTQNNPDNEDWKAYLLSLPEIDEKFDIIDKIGEGSFAIVFTVKIKNQHEIKEKFAMKFTIPVLNSNRIANEIRVLKKLKGSKNVVKLYHSFQVNDKNFMIMEYIDHKKFNDFYMLMSIDEIKEYIRNLLISLDYVHRIQIIHRDVKPDNFLYDRNRKKFALVDFGLSHSEKLGDLGEWFNDVREDSELDLEEYSNMKLKRTMSVNNLQIDNIDNKQCVCNNRVSTCTACRSRPNPHCRRGGTLGYRPPEVIMNHDIQTTAVDVWAVGIIMAIILTGNYPLFKAESDLHILYQLIHLLSLERLQSAANSISKSINTNASVTPIEGKSYAQYLQDRCQYLRLTNPRLSNDNSSKTLRIQSKYNNKHQFDNDIFELLSLLLEPNYQKRISCSEALQHYTFTNT